jgi:UDP-N-acetylglucosamine transferase subunit ALG13
MIYLTVGSAIGGSEFERLIRKADEIAPRVQEEFFAQIGASGYRPHNMRWCRYLTYDESLGYFQRASLVLGHCGTGTILNALECGVPLVVFPRSSKLGEVSDDHQSELASYLERNDMAHVVRDLDALEESLRSVIGRKSAPLPDLTKIHQRRALIENIRKILLEVDRSQRAG